jgi:fibronectin-binding autotransporter adhesin
LGNKTAIDATRFVLLGDGANTAATDNLGLIITGAFEVERDITVRNDNPSGTTTIGGSNTSGTAVFTSDIALQRNVILTSAPGGQVDFRVDNANSYGQPLGAGVIAGAFGTSIEGGGTIIFSANQVYTGATNVNDGTLLVDGSITATGAVVNVNDGGILGGNGFIGTTAASILVNGGGTLAPGSSIGTLTIGASGTGNSVTFAGASGDNAVFSAELDALSDDSDLLTIHGNLDLSSGFDELAITSLGGPLPLGDYTVISYSGLLTGEFDFVTPGFLVDYGTGFNSTITVTAAGIPEPSTFISLALGALALLGRRFRRKSFYC